MGFVCVSWGQRLSLNFWEECAPSCLQAGRECSDVSSHRMRPGPSPGFSAHQAGGRLCAGDSPKYPKGRASPRISRCPALLGAATPNHSSIKSVSPTQKGVCARTCVSACVHISVGECSRLLPVPGTPGPLSPPQRTAALLLFGNSPSCLSILFYNQSYGLKLKCLPSQ